MKKKILVWIVFVLVMLFVVPTVFAQDPLPPPTVPIAVDDFPFLSLLLVGAVTFVVTLGIKSISGAFGIDISGRASAITGAVVLAVFEFINGLLAAIPPQAVDSVVAGLGFLTALLTAFGFAGLLKKFTTKVDIPEVPNKPLLASNTVEKK